MKPKCGKSKKAADEVQPGVSLTFLSHFSVFRDLFPVTYIYMFVKKEKKIKMLSIVTSFMHLSSNRS